MRNSIKKIDWTQSDLWNGDNIKCSIRINKIGTMPATHANVVCFSRLVLAKGVFQIIIYLGRTSLNGKRICPYNFDAILKLKSLSSEIFFRTKFLYVLQFHLKLS